MNGLPPSASRGAARTPYGAAELRRVHDANLRRAFVLAALLAVTAIGGGRVLADAFAAPAPLAEPHPTWIPFVPPAPAEPPSIETPAATPPAAPSTAPAPSAIPEPVPDAAMPDEAPTTIADNGAAAPPVGVPGGNGPPSNGGVAGGDGPPIAPEPAPPVVPDPPVTPPPPTPEPPSTPDVFEIVEDMPTVVTSPVPVYPEMARQAGIEGRVYVRVRVGRDGRVREASVLRSDNAVFDEAALSAIRRWTFTPGVQAGQRVEVWMTIPIRFRQAAR